MSDIFYSEVDSNVWKELNARGQAGRISRDTKDLQFMLEKIANVAVIPYKLDPNNPQIKYAISEAILGGNTVRGGEYLPSGINGYLTDRSYNVVTNLGKISVPIGLFSSIETEIKDSDPRVNSSRRIPPFITSMDLTIGDNSMGLLNSVNINITVPNPERDLNYIESIYLRPGRHVSVVIEHPESAILSIDETAGRLSDQTLPTLDALAEQQKVTKEFLVDSLERFRKLNSICFDGLIQSFTIDYQPDMSAQITLSIIGTSNVYTDVSLIINSNNQNADPAKTSNVNQTNSDAALKAEYPSFYKNLVAEIDKFLEDTNNVPEPLENLGSDSESIQFLDYASQANAAPGSIIYGTPGWGITPQKYVGLTWITDYINRVIISKTKFTIPAALIVFTSDHDPLCVSNYYSELSSCDPMSIIMPNRHDRFYGAISKTDANGELIDQIEYYWYDDVELKKRFKDKIRKITATDSTSKDICRPTELLINLEVIQKIVNELEEIQSFTVSSLLDSISSKVLYATGGAINLKLITHPEDPRYLIWSDCNQTIATLENKNAVKPYPVPMFSNHPSGTIVRDFKFSGKLPQDASNLSYVLNSDPSEISESDIAPYVSFMYVANTVERSGVNESISSIITPEELEQINKKYADAHYRYLKQYFDARSELGKDFLNTEKQSAMYAALQKYIQYPTPTIQQSNELAAPVIPFDVEFTIDGINGLRYGDVLTFDGLPERYKKNAVFCIVSITHTVATDGQWTTTVRCIMRPKID